MYKPEKPWMDYKLHLTILICSIIAELIGAIRIPTFFGTLTLLPLIYSMILALIVYLIKPIKFIKEKQASHASTMVTISVAILLAKLGITSGAAFDQIKSAGIALLFQNLGNIGTILFAFPVAILLGFRRETIGFCHSLGREPNVALMSEKYGSESAEFRGVMTLYIVGTIFGTIIMGTFATMFSSSGILSPEATAMGIGCGSAAMLTAGVGALTELYPDMAEKLTAYASISMLISNMVGIYLSIFVTVPLAEKAYRWIAPKLNKPGKGSINDKANLY